MLRERTRNGKKWMMVPRSRVKKIRLRLQRDDVKSNLSYDSIDVVVYDLHRNDDQRPILESPTTETLPQAGTPFEDLLAEVNSRTVGAAKPNQKHGLTEFVRKF